MSKKRTPGRSLEEWMELVTECRQSGLTDVAWCNEHGISPSCFYNAVARLRKKACQIPDPAPKASTLDLTSHKQDVVQIAIEPESSPAGLIPDNGNCPMHLDNSHTIEIARDSLHFLCIDVAVTVFRPLGVVVGQECWLFHLDPVSDRLFCGDG